MNIYISKTKAVQLILAMFLGLCTYNSSQAQQQVMFTQYMFNGLVLNPAYAGSHEAISFTALSRVQWVGIEGAPNSQSFTAHSPVPNRNIAIGGMFVRDNIGVTNQNSFFLSYAYRVLLSSGSLSFGLNGGFSDTRLAYSELGVSDENLSANQRTIKPNFGTGIYFKHSKFNVGISAPFILNNILNEKNGGVITEVPTNQIRHYYITGGYVFDLNPIIKFRPSLLVKMVTGAPVEIDVNANVIIDDKIWIGVSYRSFDSINAILELQANTQFRFGYAYDFTTSDLRTVSSGSHEVMINYRLRYQEHKIITPRYF